MTFFNTTDESGAYLAELIAKARTQEDKVRALYLARPTLKASPFDVHRWILQDAPVTSVRRAMTNLTSEGFLVRTDEKSRGAYGRPCYLWARRDQVPDDQLSLF